MSLRDLASKAVMILEDGEIFTPEWKEEADKLANALRAALAEPQPEIEQLKAERDALKAAAEKGTEYVLAHINQDLRAEIEKANACIRKVEVEREKVAQWMIQRSYATGHGDTIEDLLEEMEWQVRERERKAILKQADSLGWVSVDHIRARGET